VFSGFTTVKDVNGNGTQIFFSLGEFGESKQGGYRVPSIYT